MLLHRFFSLLESRPVFTFPSRLLAEGIGLEAEAALCHAGVLAPSGPATWYACARGLRGCRRTVAADGPNLHALCGRSSGDCAAEIFSAEDLGQHALDEPALLRLLQRLFGVEGQETRCEGAGQPMALGRSAGGECEVWAWLRPTEPNFSLWMSDLETRVHGRRALVLVPTPSPIYSLTFERYGRGQPVEVVHLDRSLTIEDREIVRTPPVGAQQASRVPWAQDSVVDRQGVRVRVPAGVRWSHITIEYVNDDTVSVRVGARPPARLSAADLGLTRESAGKSSQLWDLLLALCSGNGECTRGSVGAPNLGVLRTRATRLSRRLCTVFGLHEAPLHVDSEAQSVRADFVAKPETRRASTRRDV